MATAQFATLILSSRKYSYLGIVNVCPDQVCRLRRAAAPSLLVQNLWQGLPRVGVMAVAYTFALVASTAWEALPLVLAVTSRPTECVSDSTF